MVSFFVPRFHVRNRFKLSCDDVTISNTAQFHLCSILGITHGTVICFVYKKQEIKKEIGLQSSPTMFRSKFVDDIAGFMAICEKQLNARDVKMFSSSYYIIGLEIN